MICDFCPSNIQNLFNCCGKKPGENDSSDKAKKSVFKVRMQHEINRNVKIWKSIMHNRVNLIWNKDLSVVDSILKYILKNTDAKEDTVIPENEEKCVTWHGPTSAVNDYAVMPIFDEGVNKYTYVLRILATIFADDESFDLLLKNFPRGFLLNSCNNKLCVNFLHIIVEAASDKSNGDQEKT